MVLGLTYVVAYVPLHGPIAIGAIVVILAGAFVLFDVVAHKREQLSE